MGVGEASIKGIRGSRIADRVYARLRERILLGEVEPGERITQSEVAEKLEVSHTPVREALAMLASDGLVTLQPHRGAIVNRLSPTEIDEIYEVREVLDPYVAAKAAVVATDQQLRAIEDAAETGAQEALSPSDLFEINRRFHLSIYQACGNQRLILISDSLWNSVTAIRMFDAYVDDPDEISKMNSEHAVIAEALVARDSDLAAELVRKHISDARSELIQLTKQEVENG